jgi:nitrogen regulatory protein PII
MNLKLIVAIVADDRTDDVLSAAREAGATGATVITNCRGEGLIPETSFLGLDLTGQRDVLLFVVAAPRAQEILEKIAEKGRLESKRGTGIAFQLAIEDAIGLRSQEKVLKEEIEEGL